MEVGGIEPPIRYVGQGLTGHCDQIVTLFLSPFWLNMVYLSPRKSVPPLFASKSLRTPTSPVNKAGPVLNKGERDRFRLRHIYQKTLSIR